MRKQLRELFSGFIIARNLGAIKIDEIIISYDTKIMEMQEGYVVVKINIIYMWNNAKGILLKVN